MSIAGSFQGREERLVSPDPVAVAVSAKMISTHGYVRPWICAVGAADVRARPTHSSPRVCLRRAVSLPSRSSLSARCPSSCMASSNPPHARGTHAHKKHGRPCTHEPLRHTLHAHTRTGLGPLHAPKNARARNEPEIRTSDPFRTGRRQANRARPARRQRRKSRCAEWVSPRISHASREISHSKRPPTRVQWSFGGVGGGEGDGGGVAARVGGGQRRAHGGQGGRGGGGGAREDTQEGFSEAGGAPARSRPRRDPSPPGVESATHNLFGGGAEMNDEIR